VPAGNATAAHRTALALLACGLGALALKALFRDWGWLVLVWVTMAITVGPALVLRRRSDAEPWQVWPGLVLLVPWLTLAFVPDHAYAHLIPSAATWHDVSAMLRDLHHTTSTKVAPIHSTPAVRLVLCAMLGLLTALVDLVAVVGRHGALGGVPLLVVFTIAGAVPKHPVPWPLFVLSACAFLVLLALDASDDLRSWGKRIRRPGAGRAASRGGVSAQRIGIVAVVAALLLPYLVPARHGNVLADLFRSGSTSGTGFGTGGGSIDPFVALKGDLVRPKPQPLFTVQLTAPAGHAVPFYARVNVLSEFTGSGWQRGPSGVEDPIGSTLFRTVPADSDVPTQLFRATITVSGLGGNPPVFLRPTEVSGVGVGTRWSETDQLLVADKVSRGQQLTEEWVQPLPTVQQLSHADVAVPAQLQPMLRLPAVPQFVSSLVARLTRGKISPYAKARAISDYFADPANGFSYSLHTKAGDSGNDLVDFLQNKVGFCQQYAAAMAVMLRVSGVPARVVLGYTHPTPDKNGSFTVSTDDAHAWVEAWFSTVGWVPFDPTPLLGIDGGAASDLSWAPHPHPSGGADGPVDKRQTRGSSTSARASATSGPSTSAPATTASAPSGFDTTPLWVLLVVFALGAVAFIPAGVRDLRRRRRLAAAVAAGDPDPLWSELADTAVDLGYVWSPARSPRQVAAWLGQDAAPVRASLDTLAAAVEASRYGPPARHPDVPALSRALADVTKRLRGRRSGRARALSRLWPASLGWLHKPRPAGRRRR
jgi:transglutaminase-like putative cysteine protease